MVHFFSCVAYEALKLIVVKLLFAFASQISYDDRADFVLIHTHTHIYIYAYSFMVIT